MMFALFFSPWIDSLADLFGLFDFQIRAFLTIGLVSLICGMVGAMVVANRMAFFSDAMAHCAFAGVALGLLTVMLLGFSLQAGDAQDWLVPLVMVGFSALIGFGIAYVRDQTNLATDTVIGVFFAGAMGFGAMLLTALRSRSRFDPEGFLFGNPWVVSDIDILYLLILFGFTSCLLAFRHNQLVLTSFNPTLARSRGIGIRVNNYLFIILLALIVNFSLRAVGVLLINGLLIVPAASAANVARNLRGMFWWTMSLSLISGIGGLLLSMRLRIPISEGPPLEFGPSGPILLLSVLGFFLTMILAANRALNARIAGKSVDQPMAESDGEHTAGEPFCLH